jgi:hypothetical protein
MKRAGRWFDIRMEVEVLFLKIHIPNVPQYFIQPIQKNKIGYHEKTRKKSTSILLAYK